MLKAMCAFVFGCVLLVSLPGFASDKENFSTAPRTNNGEKWRIGYYEGGEYLEYQQTLIATINGFMEINYFPLDF